MFRNYLTYGFAVAFHRSCRALSAPHPLKERLLKSAVTMLVEFGRSTRARDPKEELKCLCVALICLRDCKESLDEVGSIPEDLLSEYRVLHGRLEQLCLKASDADGGQLRMLG